VKLRRTAAWKGGGAGIGKGEGVCEEVRDWDGKLRGTFDCGGLFWDCGGTAEVGIKGGAVLGGGL
jgi:hypothetical protein